MVLNQPVLADLMARYHVSTDQISWSDLPTPIQQRLATLGIGVDELPENYKPTFDTLRVLLMLGVTEGCQIEFITKRSRALHIADDLFHVTPSSNPRRKLNAAFPYDVWGSYFWIRRLEQINDAPLRERYLRLFGIGSSEKVLSYLRSRPNEKLLEYIDAPVTMGNDPDLQRSAKHETTISCASSKPLPARP